MKLRAASQRSWSSRNPPTCQGCYCTLLVVNERSHIERDPPLRPTSARPYLRRVVPHLSDGILAPAFPRPRRMSASQFRRGGPATSTSPSASPATPPRRAGGVIRTPFFYGWLVVAAV